MPRTNAKANTWVSDLRRQIKREHGAGWKVQEQSGRARLFHTLEDGSRPSVTLNIEWIASNSTAIANEVGAYLNRGVARELAKDLKGACDDWRKAADLGEENAAEWVKEQC